jgi:hypothetical protein
LPGFLATVLAGVPITIKNLKASQFSFPAGTPNQGGEANDRGQWDSISHGVNKANAVLQHLRLALVNEHDGTSSPADGKRFVALIQHQDGKVYHLESFFLNEVFPILQENCALCKSAFSLMSGLLFNLTGEQPHGTFGSIGD